MVNEPTALLAPPPPASPPAIAPVVRSLPQARTAGAGRDRWVLAGLVVLGAALRLPNLGRAYWIDEGLSVGIASHRLAQIPGLLRLDGSPPLFYVLLHFWLRLFGSSEVSTRSMTVLLSLTVIPLAWWSGNQLFGRRAAVFASTLVATSPFLVWYATETRMYPLVAALSLAAVTLAFRAAQRASRRDALGALAFFALLLYTHDWALYLVGATAAVLAVGAIRNRDRRQLAWVAAGSAGLAVVFLPWLPTFLYQANNTAAPWAVPPALGHLFADPAAMFAGTLAVFVGPIVGLAVFFAWCMMSDRRAKSTAAALGCIGGLAITAGWCAAHLDPSWAARYLTVALPALFMATAGVLTASRRGRQLAAVTIVVLVVWNLIGASLPNANGRYAKSNVAAVARQARQVVQPGDLVVVTQSEQLAVVRHYLPSGLLYATPNGVVADPTVVDWRNLVARLNAAEPCMALAPTLEALPVGARVLVIDPGKPLGAPGTDWSKAVNRQVTAVEELMRTARGLHVAGYFGAGLSPMPFSPVHGVLFVKTSQLAVCG